MSSEGTLGDRVLELLPFCNREQLVLDIFQII